MAKKPENGVQFVFQQGLAVGFDPAAFDEAIRSQGVQLVHYRAMRCPVGLVDRYDSRRPHEDHAGCSNAHVYTEAGIVTCLFTGVSDEKKRDDIGFIDGSTVQVTSPRFYDDSTQVVQVAPFDRFYLKETSVTVPHYQLVEAHVTGRDKLSFPVVDVVDLMDASGRRYGPGDFTVEDGKIVWEGGPGFDALRNKGTIYAVRYNFRPYWYVSRLLHQVRVAQIDTLVERVVVRMPQHFVLTREIVFENEQKDDLAVDPASPRQVKGPLDGAFGPR